MASLPFPGLQDFPREAPATDANLDAGSQKAGHIEILAEFGSVEQMHQSTPDGSLDLMIEQHVSGPAHAGRRVLTAGR